MKNRERIEQLEGRVVTRLEECTDLEREVERLTAERDALRARIEDGVAGEMVDERRGERRKLQFVGHVSNSTGERIYPREGLGYQPASRTLHGKNDPRRTAGTRADRKL